MCSYHVDVGLGVPWLVVAGSSVAVLGAGRSCHFFRARGQPQPSAAMKLCSYYLQLNKFY